MIVSAVRLSERQRRADVKLCVANVWCRQNHLFPWLTKTKTMSKVLIVDDSRTNLVLLSHLIKRLDEEIEIATADHAAKALDWIDLHAPDLIIADYSMPDINGVEFTRRCRRKQNTRNVPIIMVTSARRRKVCLDALRAGATDFLNSPVNHDEFLSRAGSMLGAHRSKVRTGNVIGLPTAAKPGSAKADPHVGVMNSWQDFAAILDRLPIMIMAVSSAGHVIFANAPQAAFLECEGDQLAGKSVGDLPFYLQDVLRPHLDLDQTSSDVEDTIGCEHVHIDRYGIEHTILTSCRKLAVSPGTTAATLVASVDITSQKQAEENLIHVAEHDSLTELPNRLSLRHHVEHSIEDAKLQNNTFTLLFIDVDRFKSINDALGHDFGDRLLYAIAERLDTIIDKPNFVARLGGDEFAVVLNSEDNADLASSAADEICRRLRQPIKLNAHQVCISASVGIATYPHDGDTVDALLSCADLAMYQAKSDGGDCYHKASQETHLRACRQASLENDIRQAIEKDQFRLYFQPKIRLSDLSISGAEALIRWEHPEKGLVSPGEFLPLAEQSGLILPLGEWVLEQACQNARHLSDSGYSDLCIAINVSPCQFAKQNVPELAARSIERADIPASNVILELTEQSIIRNTATLKRDLDQIRELGAGVSLDDFGTGYASLRHVQQFPITELKIDRSFIRKHTADRNDLAIVKTILHLGQQLNVDIVAEGVETPPDISSLTRMGCPFAQGFFFSPAVPLNDFVQLLKAGTSTPWHSKELCA